MSDFSIRSDNVDVEQIMRQIRARIRDKRGVDYTEEEIRELANVKLEKFLDPRGVRSDLLEQFRRKREASLPPNYKFEDTTLYETHRGFLAFMRRLQPLYYEVIHNLVLETTRLGIDVKNLKMRVESMSSRLDFDERRARALEGVVQYRPGAVAPLQPPTGGGDSRETRGAESAEQSERRNRRRRRRGRRRPEERTSSTGATGAAGARGAESATSVTGASSEGSAQPDEHATRTTDAARARGDAHESIGGEHDDYAPAAEAGRSDAGGYEPDHDGDRSES
jgi:hypothetical protein